MSGRKTWKAALPLALALALGPALAAPGLALAEDALQVAIDGDAHTGSQLTARVTSTVAASAKPEYQWSYQATVNGQLTEHVLYGATGQSFTPDVPYPELCVTVTVGAASGKACVEVEDPPPPAPNYQVKQVLVSGSSAVGGVLQAAAAWDKTPAAAVTDTVRYTWYASNAQITYTTTNPYLTIESWMLGKEIFARVSVTATGSEQEVDSAKTLISEHAITSVTISGKAQVGATLTAAAKATVKGTWTYTWTRDGNAVTSDSASAKYVVQEADYGRVMKVQATLHTPAVVAGGTSLTSGGTDVALSTYLVITDKAPVAPTPTATAAPTSTAKPSAPAGTSSTTTTAKDTSVSLHRFYNPVTGAHFYTASEDEKAQVLKLYHDFHYEGVVGRVLPTTKAGTGQVVVHRFYNPSTGTHFYTASASEVSVVRKTMPQWHYEGAVYTAWAAADADLGIVALYRFYKFTKGVHFYTADANEAASVRKNLANEYRFEAIAYYIKKA